MPKKALVITAHPSSLGFTHKIAQAYKRGVESVGGQVEVIDLYKTELKQDFLKYENIREMPADSARTAIQQKITDANEIIFIHPLWWMGPPAIMKNFLDQNLSARFAYRYINGRRKGMLQGRSACVFITCDGPYILYLLMAMPFWSIWKFAIINFCGIKLRAFRVLDRKLFSTEAKQQRFLARAEKIGKKLV